MDPDPDNLCSVYRANGTGIDACTQTDNAGTIFTDACTQTDEICFNEVRNELNCAYETIRKLKKPNSFSFSFYRVIFSIAIKYFYTALYRILK